MSVYQIRTINGSGMGDQWENGDVWESDLIGTAGAAVREYIARLRENMIPVLPEIHDGDALERYTYLCTAEMDRMARWGAEIARVTPSGENAAQIDDGFYRVELRVIEN